MQEEEFRRAFQTHRDQVFRFLYRLARNRHDAEDLLQETFVRLWRKGDQFRGDGSLQGYLRRIAYRTYLNARPRITRGRAPLPLETVDPADGDGSPARAASRRDLERFLLARVRQAVDELPDSWRDPFVLFRYEGLRLKEIAEILELTPKAVEIRVARALKRVAEKVRGFREEYAAWRAG